MIKPDKTMETSKNVSSEETNISKVPIKPDIEEHIVEIVNKIMTEKVIEIFL